MDLVRVQMNVSAVIKDHFETQTTVVISNIISILNNT